MSFDLENTSMMAHPLHIHNVQFKVIARKGGVKGHEYTKSITTKHHSWSHLHLQDQSSLLAY
jgi:FtsP/CotA-like multicopper oxidase with cupredoxin domain